MRDLTGGEGTVQVSGATVREVIRNLDNQYPGVRDRLCEGDGLSPYINIAVDGEVAGQGMLEAVGPDSEVHILPAVGGG
jgi:sulfur-carrier protein